MKSWWLGLGTRDRRVLLIGTVVLLLVAPYFLVWEPLVQRTERLQQTVVEQRVQLAWMQQAAAEAKRLQAANVGQAPRGGGQSLLGVIDSTAKSGRLGSAVRRVQPEGQTTVRVWLENAAFDDMILWLAGLQSQHGIEVTGLVVEAQPAPGRVGARLVLEGTGT